LESAGGGTGVVVADNQGRTLRIVHGASTRSADPPVRDRPTRLSHVNVNSTDTDAARAWYEAVLGFKLTDRSKIMAFVRCNSDHHCIVIADAPVNGLNHIAFMLPELEGVMMASGRMIDHGYPIGWGVGRHGPGDNVFAYFVDPFGIVVEHTAEVLQVDDSYRVGGPQDWTWPPGRTDQWGIAPPKSEAVKAAQLAIMFTPHEVAA
jgi:catechol 2,3-dioxygenase